MRARFSDHAGLAKCSRWRAWTCCLPLHRQCRHPESVFYRGSMAGLHVPLPTLRRHPRGCLRTAWGRCGCRVEVPVTQHLPHRSHRAAFPQWALVEGQTRSRVRSLAAHIPPIRRLAASVTRNTRLGVRNVRRRLPFPSTGRLPSTLSAADLWSVLFEASTVLRSRPTPHAFLNSFVSSTSCRGPGSPCDGGRREVSQVPTRSIHP